MHVLTGEVVYPGQHLYVCTECSYRRVITTNPPGTTLIDRGDDSVLHRGSTGPLTIETTVVQ